MVLGADPDHQAQWLDGYGGVLGGAVTEAARINHVNYARTYLNGVFPMYWSTNTFDSDLGPILQPGFKVTLGTSLGFMHICFWKGNTPCDPMAGSGETDVTITFTYPQ